MDNLQDPRKLLRLICDPVKKTVAKIRVEHGGESVGQAANNCGVPEWLVERWVKEGAPSASPSMAPICRVTYEGRCKLLMEIIRETPKIDAKLAMMLSNYPACGQTARKCTMEADDVEHVSLRKLLCTKQTCTWILPLHKESVIDDISTEDE